MHKSSKIRQFPLRLLLRALGLGIQGRVHFVKDSIGRVESGSGETFKVYREVILDPSIGQPEEPGAILRVRFRFARFSSRTNRSLSLIPIPFIVAQPGFRSKIWLTGQETGAFQGRYEWDAVEDAYRYLDSFPMKLMKWRAIPRTLSYKVEALGDLDIRTP